MITSLCVAMEPTTRSRRRPRCVCPWTAYVKRVDKLVTEFMPRRFPTLDVPGAAGALVTRRTSSRRSRITSSSKQVPFEGLARGVLAVPHVLPQRRRAEGWHSRDARGSVHRLRRAAASARRPHRGRRRDDRPESQGLPGRRLRRAERPKAPWGSVRLAQPTVDPDGAARRRHAQDGGHVAAARPLKRAFWPWDPLGRRRARLWCPSRG